MFTLPYLQAALFQYGGQKPFKHMASQGFLLLREAAIANPPLALTSNPSQAGVVSIM